MPLHAMGSQCAWPVDDCAEEEEVVVLKVLARFVASAAIGLSLIARIGIAYTQETDAIQSTATRADTSNVGKIGTMHDNLRRATERHSYYEEADELYGRYSAFKARMAKENGLSWTMDVSYLPQWGRPDGGSPSAQWLVSPSVDWTIFQNDTIGTGSLQLASYLARYGTNQNAADVAGNLGLITPINDFPVNQTKVSQVTYTQAFPGNKLLLTVGQYPFYNFDGNQYLNNQQQDFNNFVLSQNAAATYAVAGVGAYAQVNATSDIQFSAGFQDASNLKGANISTRNFGSTDFAWFGYAQWSPAFKGLGSSLYSVFYYQVPTVPTQARSTGWSVNAVQNLNDTWALFGRANYAYGDVNTIRGSVSLGAAMIDPLKRSATDRIGLAFAYSDVAPPPTNPAGARNEKIIETYWNWTFAKGLLLTPAVQYIIDPAVNPSRDSVWVLSLRLTLML
jgi:porin